MAFEKTTKHTGVPVKTYTLMHAEEVVAVARRGIGVEVLIPRKMPFGLRSDALDFELFMEWLRKRIDNLSRSYMNRVYIARKVGRELENILRDSCALSITDQFWVKRSDINITWGKLQEIRDQNETLNNVALSGNTVNLDFEKAREGATSLFATKGFFAKAILGNTMLKLGGTQEYEWVACKIGKALNLPVQEVEIVNPSTSNNRDNNGCWIPVRLLDSEENYLFDSNGSALYAQNPKNTDDTLVKIFLFTSRNTSLVHASELFTDDGFSDAFSNGQHHRYFYEKLPKEAFKREFERVLILNWLISNHDMHGENFGCLYDPVTFETIGVTPSFDHNSADFGGAIPDFDVPEIVIPNLKYHVDVIAKIEAGVLDTVLDEVKDWLTTEQKMGVRSVGAELVRLFKA